MLDMPTFSIIIYTKNSIAVVPLRNTFFCLIHRSTEMMVEPIQCYLLSVKSLPHLLRRRKALIYRQIELFSLFHLIQLFVRTGGQYENRRVMLRNQNRTGILVLQNYFQSNSVQSQEFKDPITPSVSNNAAMALAMLL